MISPRTDLEVFVRQVEDHGLGAHALLAHEARRRLRLHAPARSVGPAWPTQRGPRHDNWRNGVGALVAHHLDKGISSFKTLKKSSFFFPFLF